MSISVKIYENADEVASAAGADFVRHIRALLDTKASVHISITGGTVGILTLARISDLAEAHSLDWSRVHVWWGDERFVRSDSQDRNAVQAHEALFSKISIPSENVHAFPAVPADAQDVDAALDQAVKDFEKTIDGFVSSPGEQLKFDLTFLGMGPDGHIASLFPGHEIPATGVRVTAEHNSPKPPPHRLTFTYEAINNSQLIWFVVAGADKANAVGVAFSDNGNSLPVGRVNGLSETVWYLDKSAASQL